MTKPDTHGNQVRQEGVDRCPCGSKYWENDHCIDCGGTEPEKNTTTRCDLCGDESNSAPDLMCGRIDHDGDTPCPGIYRTTENT